VINRLLTAGEMNDKLAMAVSGIATERLVEKEMSSLKGRLLSNTAPALRAGSFGC